MVVDEEMDQQEMYIYIIWLTNFGALYRWPVWG